MANPLSEYLVVARRKREAGEAWAAEQQAAWRGLEQRLTQEPSLRLVQGEIGQSLVLACTEQEAASLRAAYGDYLIIEANQDLSLP